MKESWRQRVVPILVLTIAMATGCSDVGGAADAQSGALGDPNVDALLSRSATPSPVLTSQTPTPDVARPPKIKAGRARSLKRIKTNDPVVFMTIDDGDVGEPETAALLKRRGIPVTSFLTTDIVSQSQDFFEKITQSDGQVIQNHTVTHPQLPTLDLAGQEAEICRANADLKDWYGVNPWLLRPPYGEANPTTALAAHNCGLDYLVLWTVNMPAGGGGNFSYSNGDGFQPGDIILAHWRPDLHKDLKRGLREIQRQGFRVAALQDYLPRATR
jgi:peptidoglycan/xylan/chitin deacetylase (PgdA/CDA1 family)